MSRQINFFATKEETIELNKNLDKLNLVPIPPIIEDGNFNSPNTKISDFQLSVGQYHLLLFLNEVSKKDLVYFERTSVIDSSLSSCIQYQPCSTDGETLNSGRFYFNLQPSESYPKVNSIYNQITKYIKKWSYNSKYGVYLSPEVCKLIAQKKNRFKVYAIEINF